MVVNSMTKQMTSSFRDIVAVGHKELWHNLIILQVWVDKENLMEFPLFSIYYLYNYYMVFAPLSRTHHVTFLSCGCDLCNTCDMTPSYTSSCIVSPKEKKKKSKYK